MKLLYFTLLSFFSLTMVTAQNIDWAVGIYDNSDAILVDMVADDSGNVILLGLFNFGFDCDPDTGKSFIYPYWGSSGYDYFIQKLDINGKLVWVKTIGNYYSDHAYALDLDDSGNVYIAGAFKNSLDVDPGPASYMIGSSNINAYGAYLLKLNANGDFVSVRQKNSVFIGTPKIGIGRVRVDKKTGSIYWLHAVDTTILEKISSTGQTLWRGKLLVTTDTVITPNSKFGHPNVEFQLDNNGDIIYTSSFVGTCYFNPFNNDTIIAKHNPTLTVTKINSSGTHVFTKVFRDYGPVTPLVNDYYNYVQSLTTDNNDNIYMLGDFRSTVDIDPGSNSMITTAVNPTYYILKLKPDGSLDRFQPLTDTAGLKLPKEIIVDNSDNLYITGSFQGKVVFDTAASKPVETAVSKSDAFVLCIDSLGVYQHLQQIACVRNEATLAWQLTINKDGAIYVHGNYRDDIDFQYDNFSPQTPYILPHISTGRGYFVERMSCSNIPYVDSVEHTNFALNAYWNKSGTKYQWLDCSNNLAQIAGEDKRYYYPYNAGSYAVRVNVRGCSYISPCYSVYGTGMTSIPLDKAIIYPNPTEGTFTIHMNNTYKDIKVQIFSVLGQTVSEHVYNDVRQLKATINAPSGTYYIVISSGKETIARTKVNKL